MQNKINRFIIFSCKRAVSGLHIAVQSDYITIKKHKNVKGFGLIVNCFNANFIWLV